MTDSKRTGLWVAAISGALVFAVAGWWSGWWEVSGAPADSKVAKARVAATMGESSPTPDPVDSVPRIAEHGRLSLDVDELPEEGPLALILDLPDEARTGGPRSVRVVSVDGRRIDTTASPVAGTGTGVRLEIDSDFLSRGLYMIEIDTAEPTALHLRRYVLEMQ